MEITISGPLGAWLRPEHNGIRLFDPSSPDSGSSS